MKNIILCLAVLSIFQSCIKTDLVEEVVVPIQILISPNITSLKVGEQIQLTGTYTNNYGYAENKNIVWSTSTPEIITVSSTGLLTALKTGDGILKTTVDQDEIIRKVSVTKENNTTTTTLIRQGTFMSAGAGSYTVAGDVSVITEAGKSKIIVNNQFKSSVGPSLYLLLTNHTNGSYTVNNNNPVVNGSSAQISLSRLTKFQGEMTWDVPDGIDINNYKYALFYCTLGPVFGFAELK